MTKTGVWSARSTSLSGQSETHPKGSGLFFASLVALSAVSEFIGVVMKKFGTWAATQVKLSAQICEKLATARLLERSGGQ